MSDRQVVLIETSEQQGTKEKFSKWRIAGIILGALLIGVVVTVSSIVLLGGKKEENIIPQKMSNILTSIKEEDLDFDEKEHQKLSRKFATEGMVLAQNNGLPIQKTDKVVLFGKGTYSTIYGGTGSGEVYQKGIWESIVAVKVITGIENKYVQGKFMYERNMMGNDTSDGLTEKDISDYALRGRAQRSVAVLTISRYSGEGGDRTQDAGETGTLLTPSELETYHLLVKYFDHVVVVFNVGSIMEIGDIAGNEKTSIIIAHLPGMEAGNAIADVLVGDANPSGHLSDTWAKTIDDYPTTKTFKEDWWYVKYKENHFVGYRYFELDEEKQSKVVFPFGFGLSYTTFDIKSSCSFDENFQQFTCNAYVSNTGKVKGKEVVQVYVEKPQNENFVKAKRELVAFAKTKELAPGEGQNLEMKFNFSSLASYDETGVTGNLACYVLEAGSYKIYVGTNVAETRKESSMKMEYNLSKTKVTQRLSTKIKPTDPDVANANKMPDFNSFMLNKNERQEEKEPPSDHSFNSISSEKTNEELYLPTDKLNDITLKTVLEGKNKLEELPETMTNEELAYLTYGHLGKMKGGTGIIGGNYNADITRKSLIPSADTNDGPAGLRQLEVSMQSTAWPCSTVLACTFDVDVMQTIGEETGKEARKIGTSFWLAPGMNIHRSPLCGRNFEYYSEDPLLSGKMAAHITKGLQSKRVSITLKHFAFNNKEDFRRESDSRVSERVAREIYLKGFEIAVKEAKPWAIMTSYNLVNGIHTSANKDLLTGILRNEWGYDGLIMTDWFTTASIVDELAAGLNVKMPLGTSEEVLEGIQSGQITRKTLTDAVYYTIKTISRTAAVDPLLKRPEPVDVTKGAHIKIMEHLYNKYNTISYEECHDTDGGYYPTNTEDDTFISIYIKNDKPGKRNVRIRYSSNIDGFGVTLMKYETTLGSISNLKSTGEQWTTSSDFTIDLEEGTYELTLLFTGEHFLLDSDKGTVNWIEIDE